jgi:hypothetical protein
MSVKTLLDDAAAEATIGLRIDLAAAKRQADEHRARARRRRTAAMTSAAAVAAVVALMAALLPSGAFRADSPAPAAPTDAPTGLPDRVYSSPPWTPPVTRHPMSSASMLLGTYLAMDDQQGIAPVLVSADGKHYASLPWSRYGSLVALSATGRDVAWVTQADDQGNGPERTVVHRIHLSDGHQRDVEFPGGETIERLLWDQNRLFVVGENASATTISAYTLTAGSDELTPVAPPAAALEPVPLSPNDGMIDPDPDLITAPFVVREPGSQRVADLVVSENAKSSDGPDQLEQPEKLTFALRVSGGSSPSKKFPITGSDPITDVQILGWADGGIVVRVHSRDGTYGNRSMSLRLFNPETGASQIITRGGQQRAFPLAVATDVVSAGKSVQAAEPQFAKSDRAHLRFLAENALNRGRGLWEPMVGVLGLVAVLVAIRRYRRRRAADGPWTDCPRAPSPPRSKTTRHRSP